MKKPLIIAGVILCLIVCWSCSDTFISDMFGSDTVDLEIVLNMPGTSSAATRAVRTRVAGSNEYTDGQDGDTELQRYIGTNDVYILVFDASEAETKDSETLYAVPAITINGGNGDATRTVKGRLDKTETTMVLKVDVAVNLAENKCFGLSKTGDVRSRLQSMTGKTRKEVYEAMGAFSYPEADAENTYGVWNLDAESGGRYLPMWGSADSALQLGKDSEDTWYANCDLYRSVAKMGVTVDAGCTTFELREIYVYYINNEGKFVSSEEPSSVTTVQYEAPDVPEGTTHRDISHPLVYKGIDTSSYLERIYVTEADNETADTAVVMVVGGIYKGGKYGGEGLATTFNYYRIDMKDDAGGAVAPFNLIRNHSYLFNIKNADNPGTSDPDPRRAADGLEVEILDYTDVPMSGMNTQYTLTVNKSLFSFEGTTTDVGELYVTTDGTTGWELVTDWSDIADLPLEHVEAATSTPDWIHLEETGTEHTNNGDEVKIYVDANLEDEVRAGVFMIKAGSVLKFVHVVQNYDEAANCYIVTSAGDYDLKVNYRGNGTSTAWNGDDGSEKIDIDFNLTDSIQTADIKYVGIIWETADGFVTLAGDDDGDGIISTDEVPLSASGCISYSVHDVSLGKFGNWSGSVFDPGNGANALIGAYDSGGELLWSWHIWGVGDYAGGVGTDTWVVGVPDDETSSVTERDYVFMDRNLGAYSCLPGSASFGLLYQWGRKDPFIGAYRENREQEYRKVKKQYTKMYKKPMTGDDWSWGDYNDNGSISDDNSEALLVKSTIKNPTFILEDGLLSTDHTAEVAHGLWGTTSYEFVTPENGNKTMYDPCPAGYRMPSLNSFTIWDGTNDMWASSTMGGEGGGGGDGPGGGGPGGQTQAKRRRASGVAVEHAERTLRYVPVKKGDDFRSGSPSDDTTNSTHFEASFVSNAPFYGFWLDYANCGTFQDDYPLTSDGASYDVNYFDPDNPTDANAGYITGYVGTRPSWATWLPLAGIYNGTMDHFARAGMSDVMDDEPYLPSSSLQVTSVLWANSPTSTNGGNYPAGLLLHGTEGAYAPYDTEGNVFQYSGGTADGSGGGTGAEVETEGLGYWTTDTSGNSTTASIWWEGDENGVWKTAEGVSVSEWKDTDGLASGGRHFHSYADTNASTLANPSYAASVRCIRDKDEKVHKTEEVQYSDLSSYAEGTVLDLYEESMNVGGETAEDEIDLVIAYNEAWEVTSPGKKWISVSPSSGSTTSGGGATDTIKITYNGNTDYAPEDGEQAVITVYFLATGKTQNITVEYHSGTRPSDVN